LDYPAPSIVICRKAVRCWQCIRKCRFVRFHLDARLTSELAP
jgi:hypothetical protein